MTVLDALTYTGIIAVGIAIGEVTKVFALSFIAARQYKRRLSQMDETSQTAKDVLAQFKEQFMQGPEDGS